MPAHGPSPVTSLRQPAKMPKAVAKVCEECLRADPSKRMDIATVLRKLRDLQEPSEPGV